MTEEPPDVGAPPSPGDAEECTCLIAGPRRADIAATIDIGVDETRGRFASVDIDRCGRCQRLWLRYQVEYEAFTASGRWATCPINETNAACITPEAAADFIDRQPWYIYGGSHWRHAGKRGSGKVHWDM